MDFCAGVLIQEDFVLTTAKCSLLHNNISVKAKRAFAEHVLIPGTEGLLSGWMLNGTDLDTTPMVLTVTRADREECGQTLNVTVTTRTGCEKGSVETGPWLEGSAVTRKHKGTWFLTGILGSQPPTGPSHLLLLTTVPRYSMWLKQIMK